VRTCREAGWGVVATARRLDALDGLASPDGPSQGTDLVCLELDVTRPESIQAAAAACASLRVTALVNNAGYGQAGPLEYLLPEELRAQLETNVVGLHAVTRAFLPLIRAHAAPGRGRVVHVASVLGRMNIPCAGAYSASKHAVVALGETLRLELAPEIRVILVEPGSIKSDFRTNLGRGLAGLLERVRGTRFEAMLAHYAARQENFNQSHGMEALACARKVTAALASRRPPRRLVIGRDAFWFNLAKAVLPAAVWEWGVRRTYRAEG
jgi:NAD(P)-dependent dehydrogenase (short-subunit alcohol dehydrogenase family)